MDIFLINPPTMLHERYGHSTGDIGGHLPPLGLAYIAAYVRKKGFSVSIIDGNVSAKTLAEIAESVPVGCKIVGVTSLTPNFHHARVIAAKIRERSDDVLIVLGGHHATVCTEEILANENCFDVVVRGEGELTFLELSEKFREVDYDKKRFLENNDQTKKIKGIAYIEKNKLVITPRREVIPNLDSIPLPARDLLPMEKYKPLPNNYKRLPATSIMVSRGCPYDCSFCSANELFGRKLRLRGPKKVIEELKHLKSIYGIQEVSFWDDTLTVDLRWLTKLCRIMVEEKVDISWTCLGRVNNVTPELLSCMKNAGCWNICYGLEAGSQELLDNINKGTTLDMIKRAVRWTNSAGIEIRGSFMIALPGETPELAEKTIDFAKELDLDYAQFCITTPFSGTRLFRESEKYGTLKGGYAHYNCWEPVFIPFGYKNEEEVKKMSRKAMKAFYLRPKYVFNKIRKMHSLEDVKRNLKGIRLVLGFLS